MTARGEAVSESISRWLPLLSAFAVSLLVETADTHDSSHVRREISVRYFAVSMPASWYRCSGESIWWAASGGVWRWRYVKVSITAGLGYGLYSGLLGAMRKRQWWLQLGVWSIYHPLVEVR